MNTNIIKFPNIFPGDIRINRVAFSLFGLDIYWYGIIITAGIIFAMVYSVKNARRFGILEDVMFDTAFVGIIGGFIGARAYYVIFNAKEYTFKSAVLGIRDGGLAVYGGIIAAVICAFVYTRIKRFPFLPILDLGGIALPVGQSIGRWGNFVNQEAFGAPTAGNLPWGMTGDIIAREHNVPNALVHPCFLYESLWSCLGFFFLHSYSKKFRTFDGEMFLLYTAWYGLGRGFIESLRMDSLYLGRFRISQLLAFSSCAAALGLFAYFKISLNKKSDYKLFANTNALVNCEKAEKIRLEKISARKSFKKARKGANGNGDKN